MWDSLYQVFGGVALRAKRTAEGLLLRGESLPHSGVEWLERVQATRLYWRLRTIVNLAALGIKSSRIEVTAKADAARRRNAHPLARLLRLTLMVVIESAAVLLVVGICNYFSQHFPVDILPTLVSAVRGSEGHFVSTATATAQIGATVLGLYLAALSVLMSSVYLGLTADIRRIVEDEVLGSIGVQATEFLAVLSLSFLAATAFGMRVGVWSWVALVGASILAVAGLVPSTRAAFDLLSPVALRGGLLQDAMRQFERAVREDDTTRPSRVIQTRSRERVALSLGRISSIVSNRKGAQLPAWSSFGDTLRVMLLAYWQDKGRLRPDSDWFERIYKHESWLTADYTKTGVALSAGAPLFPEEVPDYLWLERRVATLLESFSREAITSSNWSQVTSLTQSVSVLIQVAAQAGAIDAATLLAEAAERIGDTLGSTLDAATAGQSGPESLLGLEAYAQILNWPVSLTVGVLRWADKDNGCAGFVKAAAAELTRGKTPSGLPLLDSSRHLWDFRDRLAFETKVEGEILTPTWCAEEIAAYVIGQAARQLEDATVDAARRAVSRAMASVEGSGGPALVAVQIGFQTLIRAERSLGYLSKTVESLDAFHRTFDVWPEFDFEADQEALAGLRHELVEDMRKLVPRVTATPTDERMPDFVGYIYATLCETCIDALVSEQADLFSSAFDTLFQLANWLVYGRGVKVGSSAELLLALEPIIEMMELSGAAFLADKTGRVAVWETVLAVWDDWATKLGSNAEAVKRLSVLSELDTPPPVITQRSLHRHSWVVQLTDWLGSLGLVRPIEYDFAVRKARVETVSSDLVANHYLTVYASMAPMVDLGDVFLTAYARETALSDSPDLPERIRQTLEIIARQEAEASAQGEEGSDVNE